MRNLNIAGMLILLYLPSLVVAQTSEARGEAPTTLVKETESRSVFKGVLYQVWNKLRALNPQANANIAARNRVTATAGIRGTETTNTLLQPYWKDDRTNDPVFLQELKALNEAQNAVADAKLEQAKLALQQFIQRYPESSLKANAVFTLGMVLSALGDKQGGITQLKAFAQENKTHPLAEDAKLAISELSKS